MLLTGQVWFLSGFLGFQSMVLFIGSALMCVQVYLVCLMLHWFKDMTPFIGLLDFSPGTRNTGYLLLVSSRNAATFSSNANDESAHTISPFLHRTNSCWEPLHSSFLFLHPSFILTEKLYVKLKVFGAKQSSGWRKHIVYGVCQGLLVVASKHSILWHS